MGGKGGGGGGPSYQDSLSYYDNPAFAQAGRAQYEASKPKFASEADWYANYGVDPAGFRPGSSGINDPSYQFARDAFTKLFGTYKPPAPPPTPAPAAPAPAAPAPEPAAAPAPAAAAAPAPAAAPTDAGGPPDTPIGDNLSSAVLAPPKYWTGGYDSGGKNTKSRGGRMTTTQT